MTLVSTLMQPLRSKYADNALDRNELRQSRYGVLDLFKKQSAAGGLLTEETNANIKRSFGNTVVVPVLNAPNVTIGNVRSCTVVDAENTSALVTLTFATYSFGFTMYPAQHFNNDIAYQNDFNQKLEAYLLKFAGTLDTLCASKLNSDKNIFWDAAITAQYAQVANALQVPVAGAADFYNRASSIMEFMDFYGQYDVAASTFHQPVISRLANQGTGNDINQSFQFGGFNYGYSNRVTSGAGVASTAYIVPQNTLAIANRNDPDSIMGSTAAGREWGEVQMPIVGLNMGSIYYEDCTDANALHAGTTGLTATKKEGFQWSTDICLVTAYNSSAATKASPIVKAEFLTT
jgi:hypothetical protein